MRHLTTLAHILIAGVVALFAAMQFAPSSWWYEYKSIVPLKPVFVAGEKLQLVSTIIVHQPRTPITFHDQLRCITNMGDRVVHSVDFPTALKSSAGDWKRVPWAWGVIPAETPKEVPCYIRSVQTIKTIFGIERVTVYTSETFTVSDFDYTKQ